jgi:hypothetical protein
MLAPNSVNALNALPGSISGADTEPVVVLPPELVLALDDVCAARISCVARGACA